MTRIALIITLLLAGVEASALSCRAPDIATTFQEADASSDRYLVVTGRLSFDAALLPAAPQDAPNKTQPDTLIPARLDGYSLTRQGFTTRFTRDIVLNAQCFGPWCARPVPNTAYLAFVKLTDDGYQLDAGPCGFWLFPNPTRAQKTRAQHCLQGRTCRSESRLR